MKRLLILTFEFPPHPGGIGTYSYQIASNFQKMGIDVVVLTTPNTETDEENESFDKKQPFLIKRFHRWNYYPLKIIGRIVETLIFCQHHNVKVIYACSYKSIFIAFLCKVLRDIPYYLVGYGTEYTYNSKIKQLFFQKAEGYLAISNFTAELMKPMVASDVAVIPLGADVAFYDPKFVSDSELEHIREEYSLDGSPVLVSVGGIRARKGYDVTLKALVRVREMYPDVLLIIAGMNNFAGQETYEANLHKFIEQNNLSRNVRLITGAPREILRALYKMADISILSSREADGDVEGFGIVLIEANAMGTPVIASDAGGIVDAVEDGKSGFLYESGNLDDLADKIFHLLRDDTLRLEMGKYGRERALEEFNWQVVADKTWQALRDMGLSLD